MERKIFVVFYIMAPLFLSAQFTDDFSDGDFTHNPTWLGSTDKFVVESQVLRLNDDNAGMAWLGTQSYVMDNTQWEFWVRLAFTPSDNNYPKIYLVSDSDNLTEPLNGYYLRIGKTGTDNKRLYLYRQNGEDHTQILAGADNLAAASNNVLRIKVTRDNTANWEVWADPGGEEAFVPQGSALDDTYTFTQFFGVKCTYTISNSDGFYFDDFYVGEIIEDTIPPTVNQIIPTSANTLTLDFSKAVEPISAQNTVNYFVSGLGAPDSAIRPDETPNQVILEFEQDFELGQTYTLNVSNIQDFAGNVLESFTGQFAWYVPQRFDMVFNEIMANPTPEVGLPPYRYIELYNTSAFPISLAGWTLDYSLSQRELPAITVPAGGVVVLTTENGAQALQEFDHVYAVPGLPTSFLTIGGRTLSLRDEQGELISYVSYTDQWYQDPEKAEGGWALEKMDPYNYCGEASNWQASQDPRGGTPGVENSVFAENPDSDHPQLMDIVVKSDIEIMLHFNESMDESGLLNTENYSINHGVGYPLSASPVEPAFKKVHLILSQPLQSDRVYQLALSDHITDCAGNEPVENSLLFADYQSERYDLIISEIMANPTPEVGLPPHKYLEVYNASEFPISLSGWTLTYGDGHRELPPVTINSQSYMVLTTREGAKALQGMGPVVSVTNLPATTFLTQGGQTLTLVSPENELISFVSYSDQWYGDASKAEGGWALEKIDPYNFCGGKENWSASNSEKGGTPGQPNSIMDNNPDIEQPYLLRAGYESPNTISLFFNEPMEEGTLLDTRNYKLSPDIGEPLSAEAIAPHFNKVILTLHQEMAEQTIYEVSIAGSLTDCAGNPVDDSLARVGIPKPADSLDMVINEVLFNPHDRGERYVEIYNRSDHIIELQNHMLTSRDTLEDVLITPRSISSESQLFFPGEYRVVTPDPQAVKSQYMTNNPLGFISANLPSMTNTSGIIVLASKGQRIIDKLIYHEEMHYELLTDKKGVALERLNYHRPTQEPSNWHSAAQNAGFGTPGYKNSQFTNDPDSTEDMFEVYPRIFSPNNDGVDDVLNIAWEFESPGYTANIQIYDSRGRLVRKLTRSKLLPVKGVTTWDGTTDDNLKANIGIYVIFIELFDPQGNINTYKKTAVLAGRL